MARRHRPGFRATTRRCLHRRARLLAARLPADRGPARRVATTRSDSRPASADRTGRMTVRFKYDKRSEAEGQRHRRRRPGCGDRGGRRQRVRPGDRGAAHRYGRPPSPACPGAASRPTRDRRGPPRHRRGRGGDSALYAAARRDGRARCRGPDDWDLSSMRLVLDAEAVTALLAREQPDGLLLRDTDRSFARLVGALLAEAGAGSELLADAHAVAAAVEVGGGVVLTGDVDDLSRLAGP